MKKDLRGEDYPIAEKHPERVVGARGRSLADLTLDAVMNGDVEMEDFRIASGALRDQASVARAVDRSALADNFERAAEMTRVPQEDVMRIYELLRPGRAESKNELLQAAAYLRETLNAGQLAAFVEEAADVYERRGLFQVRF